MSWALMGWLLTGAFCCSCQAPPLLQLTLSPVLLRHTPCPSHPQQQPPSAVQDGASRAADGTGEDGQSTANRQLDSGATTESSMQAKPVMVKRSCTEAMLKVGWGFPRLRAFVSS